MSTSKQVALITGASAGIGATYADRLAKRGYALVLVARDTQRLQALATRLQDETGTSIEVLPADLTRNADVVRIEQRLQTGDVTLLVNNAGMSLKGGLLENGPAALEQIIALNVTAPTRLAAAAAKFWMTSRVTSRPSSASITQITNKSFRAAMSTPTKQGPPL